MSWAIFAHTYTPYEVNLSGDKEESRKPWINKAKKVHIYLISKKVFDMMFDRERQKYFFHILVLRWESLQKRTISAVAEKYSSL